MRKPWVFLLSAFALLALAFLSCIFDFIPSWDLAQDILVYALCFFALALTITWIVLFIRRRRKEKTRGLGWWLITLLLPASCFGIAAFFSFIFVLSIAMKGNFFFNDRIFRDELEFRKEAETLYLYSCGEWMEPDTYEIWVRNGFWPTRTREKYRLDPGPDSLMIDGKVLRFTIEELDGRMRLIRRP